MRMLLWLWLILPWAMVIYAADPQYMGVQVRAGLPSGDRKEFMGPFGTGMSFFMEYHLEDGYAMRLTGNWDNWGNGASGQQGNNNMPVENHTDDRARVVHCDVDGVKFLNFDNDPNFRGSYFIMGAGIYGWTLTHNGESTRSLRLGGNLGFGYRLNTKLNTEFLGYAYRLRTDVDVEIRVCYCPPEADFQATYISLALGYRF